MKSEPPVPHYDDIPLSELPKRLAGVEPDELRALMRFEKQHENRLAVLQTIGNLITGSNSPQS